jgi:hypothetical protein
VKACVCERARVFVRERGRERNGERGERERERERERETDSWRELERVRRTEIIRRDFGKKKTRTSQSQQGIKTENA